MVLIELPHQNTHLDLFFNYKQNNEFLGISEFNKLEFNYSSFSYINDSIKNFFEYGIEIKNLVDLYSRDIILWRSHIENYTKLVWLTWEYITNDYKFKNYIGTHYNLNEKIWEIHPGGSRQLVFYFFGPEKIEALAFNTGGEKREFLKIFNTKEELLSYFNHNLYFVLTADQGTLIPHIHFEQENLKKMTQIWAEKVQKFWNETNVVGDVPNYIIKINKIEKKKTLELKLDNENNPINLLKGLMLLPIFDNYNDHGVKITNVSS